MLHIRLHTRIGKGTTDEALSIKYGIVGIHGSLGLGSVSNETFSFIEGDVGRGGPVSLVVGDDLNAVILPYSDARVGCS